jgi:tape measure domain-containing protein
MSSQIASLFAKLGFDVDTKGLKEFEKRLNRATRQARNHGQASAAASNTATRATNKTRKTENQLAKDVRRNYAKVRTDRKQAVADIKRINDELSAGGLKKNQKKELREARGRTQQRLDDLTKQETAARDRLQKQAEARNRKTAAANDRLRRDAERRDEQSHRARTERAREEQRRARRTAAENARIDRQNSRDRARRRSIQERRDYEAWRQRGDRARQERDRERRFNNQRNREDNRRRRGGGARGARNFSRGIVPGIGGAYALVQSTRSYQGHVGTQAGLTAATGSQEQAEKEFKWLEQLSKKLGVFVGDMSKGFTSLSANTRNTSLEGQGTRDIFEAVASYSRVLNLSAADQNGVLRALTQMVGKGQVYAEELRQQMGERLPGSFQAMARASGYGSDEAGVTAFYKAVENGEIKATEVFPEFANELMKMANEGGALERSINNTSAAIGRFRTNVYLANKTMNESGYDVGVRNLMNRSSEAINRAEPFWDILGKTLERFGDIVEVPVELFGALSERIPQATAFIKKHDEAFKLLGASIVLAVKPLRSLFLLYYGMASISDLLLDPDRDRSWQEWVSQLTLAGGALFVILGTIKKILGFGSALAGMFGGGTAAGAAARMSLPLRVTVVGIALSALTALGSLIYDIFENGPSGDTGSDSQSKQDSLNLPSNPDKPKFFERSLKPLLNSSGGVSSGDLPFGPQMIGRKPPGYLTDSNIDEHFKPQLDLSFLEKFLKPQLPEGYLNDRNIENHFKPQLDLSFLEKFLKPQLPEGYLNDSNFSAWFEKQGEGQSSGVSQSIGDVYITVESSDPEAAGFDVETAFQNMLTDNLRRASSSQQVTEK